MLGYVFWHWRQPRVDPAEYERLQRDFHAALAAAPPPGYRRSYSHALAGAPWAGAGGEAYEDWYLVDGSAALDPLNEAAVSASRQGPHDAAAAVAAGGTAGLYGLRLGRAPAQPRHAWWFDKPDGVSYGALWELLGPVVEAAGAALWLRHMVLGPTPELCLQADDAVALPPPLAATAFALRPVWPAAERTDAGDGDPRHPA